MDQEKNVSNVESDVLGEYSTVDNYTQNVSRAILQAIRCGHTLPSHGDDFDYYSSFDSFRSFMDIESSRLLQIIQQLLRYHGLKGNLATSSATHELEDKFDVLVDANDQLLERAGSCIDEAAGIKKEVPLLLASTAAKPGTEQGSWNKKGRAALSSKGFRYRLLAAQNIQRPQLKFKDTLDNSPMPFVPKIHAKPHAVKTLEEVMSLQMELEEGEKAIDDHIIYPHPYQYELDHFQPPADQLKKRAPQMPKPLEETELLLVKDEAGLEQLCRDLEACDVIAVDLEHHSYRTYLGFTCLMQISTRDKDYIVDTLELRSELHVLNHVFADPAVVKVLHGADSDVEWLQRDLGLYLVNMFDTGQASRVLGFSRYSLAHLMQHYCGVDPDKQFQLADWRIRPLPEELVRYAREDTHYLLYIYDRMHSELLTRANGQTNLLLSVIDRSRQICSKKYEKPQFRESDYETLYKKSKKVFNSQQLHALKTLYAWRDRTARNGDESTGFVLPNHMLLQIAETLPRDAEGIMACCNPIPPVVRQNNNELFGIIKASRQLTLYKVESTRTNLKPTRHEHPKYSVDHLLHCPHDTSRQQRPLPELGVDAALAETARLSSGFSRLLGQTRDLGSVTSSGQRQPLFGSIARKTSTSSLNEKVQDILFQLKNPFEKYFPAGGGEAVMTSDKMSLIASQASDKWLLKRHTRKRVEQTTEKLTVAQITQPNTTQQKIALNVTEDEIKAIQPLRSQMPPKRSLKKAEKQQQRADRDVASDVSSEDEDATGSGAAEADGPRAKRAKETVAAEGAAADKGAGSRVRPSVEDLETHGFRGHDYSQRNFDEMFEGAETSWKKSHPAGRGRARGKGGIPGRGGRGAARGASRGGRYYAQEKDFNPNVEPTCDHQAAKRPNMYGNASSQKSISYGRGRGRGGGAKIQWPKH